MMVTCKLTLCAHKPLPHLRHEHLLVDVSLASVAVERAVVTKRVDISRLAAGFLEPLPLHVAQVTLA